MISIGRERDGVQQGDGLAVALPGVVAVAEGLYLSLCTYIHVIHIYIYIY